MTIRALRNNNPGNIVAGEPWMGLMPPDQMSPEQQAEDRFAVFKAPMWGFRALALILMNYSVKHGINTVQDIIARWAPPVENDTAAYVDAVAKAIGVLPSAVLTLTDANTLRALCMAISTHECGSWMFKTQDLDGGVNAACAGANVA